MTRTHDSVPYDIALLGATGFTGSLAASYLVEHAPAEARLALAGRDRAKLESLIEELGRPDLGLMVVDVNDSGSVGELAAGARVVISTVGPYMSHGEPLVAACAAAGTDYVDIAGEWEFVDLMYLRYHAAAKASGARLVHCCGFESIPVDLGALFTVSQLQPDVPIALQGFTLSNGAISAGTLRTALEALSRLKQGGRISRQRRTAERHAEDGQVGEERRVRGIKGRLHREPVAGGWVVSGPTIDPQNVLRSARLSRVYGPDFSYSHHLVTRKLHRTAMAALGLSIVVTLAQFEHARRLMLKLKRPGPSAERRARSFFRVRFIAEHGDGPQRLITEVRGGDPGYEETAKMVCEAALCLAFDDVPAPGGGQWTPALACGQPLIDRLMKAGIEFAVVEPG
jgi:saccharopine dehydrogenase (NAD+, L-glutamate forming)